MDMDYESNKRGKIEIAPEVIQFISGIAATSIKGVAGLSGGGVVNDLKQWLGRKNFRKGIQVKLEEPIKIDISLILYYGYNLPEVGYKVQEKVKAVIGSMIGLSVSQVIVRIDGIHFQE